jgi:hypothetical protein
MSNTRYSRGETKMAYREMMILLNIPGPSADKTDWGENTCGHIIGTTERVSGIEI